MKWLLVLLLLTTVGDGEWHLRFPRLATPLGQVVFALAAAAAIWFTWWNYRHEPAFLAPRRRRLLTGLRTAAVAILLFICTGAFIDLEKEEEAKGRLLMLVDVSQSMGIADRREAAAEVEEAKRILAAGGATADPAKATRVDLVRAAFASDELDLVGALGDGFAVEAYTFGQGPQLAAFDLAPRDEAGGRLAKLPAPEERATHLGDALMDAVRRAKGRAVDGIVVLSDGGWNRGEDPVALARTLGVPVHTVGIGLAQSRDLEVSFLHSEDVLFKNDRTRFEVRLRSRGYPGRSIPLRIKRIDERGVEETVKEERVELGQGGDLTRMVEVQPDREGTYTFVAELAPQDDEPNTVNNRKAKTNVRVIDRKIGLLVVEDAPRWEFRYLRAIAEGDRQRVQPTYILRQADERAAPGKILKQFPRTIAELRKYDCIVIGDVLAEFFAPEDLRLLEEWVRVDGGGLAVIAGRRSMPGAFMGTPLEQLLPVEPDAQASFDVQDEVTRTIAEGFRPVLTPDGKRVAALRFSADEGENDRFWAEASEWYWFQPVRRLKPGAAAWLEHPTRTLGDGAPMPVVASQRYGKGQVLFFASDETWRWRFHPGTAQHRRFWGQTIGMLAMGHLLGGGSNRTSLVTDKGEYAVGERATVIARVLDRDYNPLLAESVTVTAELGLVREQITLAARRQQPGSYSGEWIPPSTGRWRLSIAGTAPDDPGDERTVDVTEAMLELDDAGMREELLRQIAQASGGSYAPLAGIRGIADAVVARERVAAVRRQEITLWNAPGVMILLALCLGLEWFLRKRSDLL